MTIQEIIDGLQTTIDFILFDPSSGGVLTKDQLNDLDKTTVEACEEAIKIIKLGDDCVTALSDIFGANTKGDKNEITSNNDCTNDRLYIKVYADMEPQEKAEKLYQICDKEELKEVYEWFREYCGIEISSTVSKGAFELIRRGEWVGERKMRGDEGGK